MEMSKELEKYVEEHKDGMILREIPDELLIEMLAKATECEVDGKKKGTDSFQKFYNLDMSYTTALKEPETKGYKKVWVKGNDAYDVNTGEKVELDVPEVSPFSMEEFCKLVLGKSKRKDIQRLYIKAFPESLEELKRVCDMFPRGIKGQMEAIIFEEAIRSVVAKYERLAKDVEEF